MDDAEFALRLIDEATRPAKEIVRMLREMRGEFGDVDRSMKSMKAESKGVFGELIGANLVTEGLRTLGGAAVEAAQGVAHLAESFIESSVHGARFAESSIQAITQLTHSATTGTKEFDAVRKDAAALGLDVEDTVHSFQKLLAAQFEIGKAKELIRMSADLQVIGASGEEVQRVLMAITQIKSKGRLQAEEMLQLQEAGVSAELVYAELGKTLGKTREELAKMQQAGQIDATTGIEAILGAVRAKTHTNFAGEAARANNTIDGMLGKLKGTFDNAMIDVGMAVLPNLQAVVARIPELFEDILGDPALQDLGRHLLSEFDYFIAWMHGNWPEIKDTVLEVVDGIVLAFKAMGVVIDWTIDHWDGLKLALEAVAATFLILEILGALMLAPIIGLGWAFVEAASAVSENWDDIKQTVLDGINWLKSLGSSMYQVGVDLIKGLIQGIVDSIPGLRTAMQWIGESSEDALRKKSRTNSPSEAFADVGFDMGAGVGLGWQRAMPDVLSRIETSLAVDRALPRVEPTGLMGASVSATSTGDSGGGRVIDVGGIHVTVQAAPGEKGEELAERLASIIEAKVLTMFYEVADV